MYKCRRVRGAEAARAAAIQCGQGYRDIRLLSERGGYNGQLYAGTDELCDEIQPIGKGYTGDSLWV